MKITILIIIGWVVSLIAGSLSMKTLMTFLRRLNRPFPVDKTLKEDLMFASVFVIGDMMIFTIRAIAIGQWGPTIIDYVLSGIGILFGYLYAKKKLLPKKTKGGKI